MATEVLPVWYRIGFLCFLVALSCGRSGAVDRKLQIVVGDQVARQVPSGDPEVSMFHVNFGLRITNVGDEAVVIGTERALVVAVQHRKADGVWDTLFRSSLYFDANPKFGPCSSLAPGVTTVTRKTQTRIALLKGQVDELGAKPTLRFMMQLFCRRRDGKDYHTGIITTDPFVLRIPPLDHK